MNIVIGIDWVVRTLFHSYGVVVRDLGAENYTMEIVIVIDWVVRRCFPSQLVVVSDLEAENYNMEIVFGIAWVVRTCFPHNLSPRRSWGLGMISWRPSLESTG